MEECIGWSLDLQLAEFLPKPRNAATPCSDEQKPARNSDDLASGKPWALHCWHASLPLVLSGTLPPPLTARTLWNRAVGNKGELEMPLYMYQAAYAADSWAAQIKNPQNRIQAVGQQACEAVGGKLVGAWLCFGDYDLVMIADVPDNESMAAVVLATGSGGAIKSGKTTVLLTGEQGVEALKKASAVARGYTPAR